MSLLRIEAVERPFRDPRVLPLAVAALVRADAMGLLEEEVFRLDDRMIPSLLSRMHRAGIARTLGAGFHEGARSDPEALAALFARVIEVLEGSPAVAHEWRRLGEVLGLDLLGRLLGISPSSARRYAGGARATPDAVAARLHFLAFTTGDLAGAYNDIGVRRWFSRPRQLLGGRTPASLLGRGWSPDGAGPRRVAAIARALGSPIAT